MKKVSIVGFGRFGKTLYRLIKNDFFITIFDKDINAVDGKLSGNTKIAKDIFEIYQSEVIFFAVPISSFETVISTHKKHFTNNHVLIDVLSVKMHPAQIFKKYLTGLKTQALLTHPMFGPDSSKNGFNGLSIIIDQFMANNQTCQYWSNFFKSKGLHVPEMTAKNHDKMAASSQGLTHFIGKLLQTYPL